MLSGAVTHIITVGDGEWNVRREDTIYARQITRATVKSSKTGRGDSLDLSCIILLYYGEVWTKCKHKALQIIQHYNSVIANAMEYFTKRNHFNFTIFSLNKIELDIK